MARFAEFQVGDEVVLLYCGAPFAHAGVSSKHCCRGRVLSVGSKFYHVSSAGAPVRVRIDNSGTIRAYSVKAAKAKYRENLVELDRDPDLIERLVSAL